MPRETPAPGDSQFEVLLEFVRAARGFDFSAYKRPTLTRRIAKRLNEVGIADGDYESYRDYLELHPDEFEALFDTILINVTGFFRDKAAWDMLRRTAIEQILRRDTDTPIRVWSAGCASGEEAYTAAIVLADAIGEEECKKRVKIYATDVDEDALTKARSGTYTDKQVDGVPPDLLERYFEQANDRYAFRPDLRRTVIFGRHDLTSDAPISRLDLLICRNTLMYLIADAQRQILTQFHYALRPNGFLFLGRAETLISRSDLFLPVEQKHRIFKPNATTAVQRRGFEEPVLGQRVDVSDRQQTLGEVGFDSGPQAQVLVDTDGHLVLANSHARAMFAISERDIGRPFHDLEVSYRPVELRSCIERAYAEGVQVTSRAVERSFPGGGVQRLDVAVTPLMADGMRPLGVSIVFTDVTEVYRLRLEVERRSQELETTNEELQSTNEELETSNEELQSTNEELETTNEELQSTNEELETTNEELQSTNDELQTMNDELQQHSGEIDRMNAFLNTILSSVDVAVIVVDSSLRIELWNDRAEDLWGLRADEVVGAPFVALDIGLPVGELAPLLRSTLTDSRQEDTVVVAATNRRGQAFRAEVDCMPLLASAPDRAGAVILIKQQAEM